MSHDDSKRAAVRQALFGAIQRVAPEADPAALDEGEDLRDALDIDSMDILNIATALHQELGIDIPERDYPKLACVRDAVEYLLSRS